MFELNLIKDKAKARQRRRVIFVTVVSILFLSALFSMFIGHLFYQKTIELEQLQKQNSDRAAGIAKVNATLAIDEPAAQLRRNGLIVAYKEDEKVFLSRRTYQQILEQLWRQKPRVAEFWYDQITIDFVRPGDGQAEVADHEMLLGFRSLDGSGIVEIERNKSDKLTSVELEEIARSMSAESGVFRHLLGRPTFELQIENELKDTSGGGQDVRRYIPFRIRAKAVDFLRAND